MKICKCGKSIESTDPKLKFTQDCDNCKQKPEGHEVKVELENGVLSVNFEMPENIMEEVKRNGKLEPFIKGLSRVVGFAVELKLKKKFNLL
jgi:hypothetical protein